ncbi:MAG: hypothetical protein ABIG64_00015 [Candidatus Omnitrophota bacterium]
METIEKLHLAITIADHWQTRNSVFNRGLGIPYIVANLDKFEYEISCISVREPFTQEEAEERYINAVNDRAELAYDRRLYRQECLDHNF